SASSPPESCPDIEPSLLAASSAISSSDSRMASFAYTSASKISSSKSTEDAGVSLVLQIDNTLLLIENVNSEATKVAWTLSISMAMRERTRNVVSFAFQKPKSSKVSNSFV
nr:hypothetical protein [Tanacetum cinerariifolium]